MVEKKANPWVKALKQKKAPIDLHPDVLRAVLKMNPDMRGGDKSTEEVGQLLMNDLPVKGPAGPGAINEGKFKNVFSDMLTEFNKELDAEVKALELKRKELDQQESKVRDTFVERIIEFLAEVQPGPLSNAGREIYQKHLDFFKRLRVDAAEISRRAREKSETYK